MKKWGFLICIVLIGYIVTQSPGWLQQKKELPIEIQNTHENPAGYTASVTGNIHDQVHKGNLLLVNKQYPVEAEGVKSDIVYVADEDEPASWIWNHGSENHVIPPGGAGVSEDGRSSRRRGSPIFSHQ